MATATTVDAITEGVASAVETIEQNMRKARRAVAHGKRTAEDVIDTASLSVRRHPMSAVMLAAGAGALAGCVLGYVLGRRNRRGPCPE